MELTNLWKIYFLVLAFEVGTPLGTIRFFYEKEDTLQTQIILISR